MKIFGKSLSEYVSFEKEFLILTMAVGMGRLILSLKQSCAQNQGHKCKNGFHSSSKWRSLGVVMLNNLREWRRRKARKVLLLQLPMRGWPASLSSRVSLAR